MELQRFLTEKASMDPLNECRLLSGERHTHGYNPWLPAIKLMNDIVGFAKCFEVSDRISAALKLVPK